MDVIPGAQEEKSSQAGAVKSELDALYPELFHELRRMALGNLRRERPAHTMQATDLVNEAYLRLSQQEKVRWKGRSQVLAAAGRVMRRILVDHARTRKATKRGGGAETLPLEEALVGVAAQNVDVVALDQSLERLGNIDPQAVRVVELRYFAGFTLEETAETMGISTATVKREWAMARAWLFRELSR